MACVSGDSRAAFWQKIERTDPSTFNENHIVGIDGRKLGTVKTLRKQMDLSCTKMDPFMEPFLKLSADTPLKVLDLGAGLGANSVGLAKNGSSVIAIDLSKELLRSYSNQCKGKSKNVRWIVKDLTQMDSFIVKDGPEKYDLVIAVDILPYIPPSSLQSTMEKIHQVLSDRGTLIGTLFTTQSDPLSKQTQNLMRRLGVHFYDGNEEFIRNFLNHSGFTEKEIEKSAEGYRFQATKS